MATGPCYWRPWWTASASPGPLSSGQLDPAGPNARAGPDGPLSPSGWLRSQAAVRLSPLPPPSSNGSGRPSRPVSVKPRPRQIGLDKPPEAVNNYLQKSISKVCCPIFRSSLACCVSSQRRLPKPGKALPGPWRNSRRQRCKPLGSTDLPRRPVPLPQSSIPFPAAGPRPVSYHA